MRPISWILVSSCLVVGGLQARGRHPPLPIPPHARTPPGVSRPRVNHAGRAVAENLRTRLVERAVARAGGWMRWRELEKLFLRVRRRRRNDWGEVVDHREETWIYGRDSLYRYWLEDGNSYAAGVDGRHLVLVEPPLPRGAPEAVELQLALERQQFWIAHPFLLYRPGVRTRYMGIRPTRGTSARMLRAEFSPGASPYRRVDYLFDRSSGDLLVATAYPEREGEPVEEYHFTGGVRGPEGLRLPRRRELRIDGVTREVLVILDLSTTPPRLPPSPLSPEGRERARVVRRR